MVSYHYAVVAVACLAAVVIAVAVLRRRRTSVKYKDGKREIFLEASDPPDGSKPRATIRDATSREGGATAHDATGAGALLERVSAKGDLVARVTSAPAEKKTGRATTSD